MATAALIPTRASSTFWPRTAYAVVIGCIVAFLALTTLGMLIYPGGTNFDKTTVGYQFFTNYFSDLGRTVAHNGVPNSVASPLFTLAMTCAGTGLALFFVAFARLLSASRSQTVLCVMGTIAGAIAGVCFAGVGFAPSNVQPFAHAGFVFSAFITFFIAVVFYIAAILRSKTYPHGAALAFIAFAVLLAAYIWLQFNGPRGRSPNATLIQAASQKAIVYASVFSVLAQSLVARRVAGGL